MTDTTWYAWTTIHSGENTTQPGEVVSADSLGIDEGEFVQLVEARAVRTLQYPDMSPGYDGSPREFVLKRRREELDQLEDEFDNSELLMTASTDAYVESADEPTEATDEKSNNPPDTGRGGTEDPDGRVTEEV